MALLLLGILALGIGHCRGFLPLSHRPSPAPGIVADRRFTQILKTSSLQDAEAETSEDQLPSSSSRQFDWNKQWYPIAVESTTDRGKPHQMMFLGNDIVLWHDGNTWRVFEDSCPHRGVPLSEGRVEKNGELLCAYHAWTFDGEGRCTHIPQTETDEKESAILSRGCVKSYPTQVLQGLIWVWGEKGEPGSDVAIESRLKKPRTIEELEDPKYHGRIAPFKLNFYDIPYGWDMFMENVMDPAHVPVSHHGITGNRYKDAVPVIMDRVKGRSETPIHEGGELNPSYPEDAGFRYALKFANEVLPLV